MAELLFENIYKKYDKDMAAVNDFNLHIKDTEFIVFVGPSGCGKSTTLQMIAGLEEISEGKLYINHNLVNDFSPKARNIAMVFQNYALYPHMSVYDNMAVGLKLRKVNKREIDRRVQHTAKMLGLDPYLDRKPKALSGGQRQRVALGRAIVREAQVFLMDEPLSNLDAKLRVQMRAEIVKLHKQLQTTTIYVTHDQTEAMTMATRIVVMNNGRIQQVDTPEQIYDYPANVFVGSFIGSPGMNFLQGYIEDNQLKLGQLSFSLPEEKMMVLKKNQYNHKEIIVGIRPEKITTAVDNDVKLEVKINMAELTGSETYLHAEMEEQSFTVRIASTYNFQSGEVVELGFKFKDSHFFDNRSQTRLN